MEWSLDQRNRLAWEKNTIEVLLPGLDFSFQQPTGNTYLSCCMPTNWDKKYEIRIYIPSGYPDQCPKVYIVRPNPLPGFLFKNIQSYGACHEMHTLKPHTNGWVQVCHFRKERWDASCNLCQVLVKVRIWLEAYEGHCTTGSKIRNFVLEMK